MNFSTNKASSLDENRKYFKDVYIITIIIINFKKSTEQFEEN